MYVFFKFRAHIQKSQSKDVIKLPYLDLAHNDSFFHFLKYMYTGKLQLINQEIDRVFDMMLIAKTLELTSMSEDISLLLINSLTIENVALVYEEASRYDQTQLMLFCENFIDKNAEILFTQKSLAKLPSQYLEEIIRRESLNVSEKKIFKLVMCIIIEQRI